MKPRNQSPLRLAVRSSNLLGLSTLTVCFLGAGQAFAQDTWDGGAGTGNWADNTNWLDDTAPSGSTGTLTFVGNTQNSTTNNITGLTSGAINLTNDVSAGKTNGFTIAGNSIILGGNITTSAPTVAGNITDTISLNMDLSADRTFALNRNSSLGNHNLTVTGEISGIGSLTKTGGSTLTLSNTNNSFSGAMNIFGFQETIVASIAASGSNSSIGSGSSIGFTGGTLNINGTSSGTINRALALNISTGQTGRIDNNNASSSHAFTFNGTLTNTQGTTGTSTFALGGSNAGDNIFASTLINGTGSNVTAFQKLGGGTWTLSGNSTYTGQSILENGTLKVSKIADTGDSNLGYGSLRIGQGSGGGNLEYTGVGNSTARQVTIGNNGTAGNINGGATILNTGANGGSGLRFTHADFNTTAANPGAGTATRVLQLGGTNTDANEIVGIIKDGNTSVITALTKSGTGRWILAGSNSYTGTTTVSGGGVLQLDHTSAIPGGLTTAATTNIVAVNGGIIGLGAGDLTRNLGTGAGQISLGAGAGGFAAYGGNRAVNFGGSGALVTWITGGFFVGGSNTMALSHSTATHTLDFQNAIDLNAFTRTIDVANGAAPVDAKLSGAISGASGSNLVKAGAGTLELSVTSSYVGTTNVNNGKLVVNGNISTSSLTTVASGATLGGTGTVGKAIINGTLAVGNSPGQMDFTDTLGLNGTVEMEIDGTAGAGVTGGHDFTNLTGLGAAGVLTYGGTMTLDIGVIFGVGTYSWNLFDMASETGTFATITLADLYSGSLLDGDLNGVWDLTSGSDTWQFTESTGVLGLTVVPEPRAALLGGLGLLALLRRRRN